MDRTMDFDYERAREEEESSSPKRKSEADHFEESMLAKRLALDLSLAPTHTGHHGSDKASDSRARKKRGRVQQHTRKETSHVLVPLSEIGYEAGDEADNNPNEEEYLVCPRAIVEAEYSHKSLNQMAILPYVTPEMRMHRLFAMVQQESDFHVQQKRQQAKMETTMKM